MTGLLLGKFISKTVNTLYSSKYAQITEFQVVMATSIKMALFWDIQAMLSY
jgi:hypothetical protein